MTENESIEQEASEKAIPEKKESKGMIVYCMDISSSVGINMRLPQLQGSYESFYHFNVSCL